MKIQITKGDLLRVLSARFAVEVSDVEVISDKENISLADAIRKGSHGFGLQGYPENRGYQGLTSGIP